MGVSSGRSRVSDQAFRVLDRAVHPEWFDVKVHRRVARRGWEADLRIVRGGHCLVWGSGSARVSEILVPSEHLLPESGQIFQSGVRRERSTQLAPDGRVEYQTCFAAERLDHEVFAHLNEELALDPARGDLAYRYEPTRPGGPSAVSLLHVEARGRGLSIQAFHSFPDERAIIRVQSLFEIVG